LGVGWGEREERYIVVSIVGTMTVGCFENFYFCFTAKGKHRLKGGMSGWRKLRVEPLSHKFNGD